MTYSVYANEIFKDLIPDNIDCWFCDTEECRASCTVNDYTNGIYVTFEHDDILFFGRKYISEKFAVQPDNLMLVECEGDELAKGETKHEEVDMVQFTFAVVDLERLTKINQELSEYIASPVTE